MSSSSFVLKSFNHAWSVEGSGEIAEEKLFGKKEMINFQEFDDINDIAIHT